MRTAVKRLIITTTIFVVSMGIFEVNAGEWSTTKGEFCINRCMHSEDSGFYFCYVTDPLKVFASTKTIASELDTKYKWDYCVPRYYRPEQQEESDVNDGGRPNYEEQIVSPRTALYPTTECVGDCTRNAGESSTSCVTETDNPTAQVSGPEGSSTKWFYCVDEQRDRLIREQISAIYGYWCINRCKKEGTNKAHYTCDTLYGPDHCSPSPGRGSEGTMCITPCAKREEDSYYYCYTKPDNSTWEYCGLHSPIEFAQPTELEFTEENDVCADICKKREEDRDPSCDFVRWRYNVTTQKSVLERGRSSCGSHLHGGNSSNGRFGTLFIVIVVASCVIALVAIALVVTICVKYKGYRSTPTAER